jgi:hypothetical protein
MLWLGASNVKVYPEILDGIGVFFWGWAKQTTKKR